MSTNPFDDDTPPSKPRTRQRHPGVATPNIPSPGTNPFGDDDDDLPAPSAYHSQQHPHHLVGGSRSLEATFQQHDDRRNTATKGLSVGKSNEPTAYPTTLPLTSTMMTTRSKFLAPDSGNAVMFDTTYDTPFDASGSSSALGMAAMTTTATTSTMEESAWQD